MTPRIVACAAICLQLASGVLTASIYPKANTADAPYSLTESQLRSALYIPSTFTYGDLPIVVFLPGTASTANSTFNPNFARLIQKTQVADPVFVNIPGNNLGDIQVAAEYTAYAVNYISSVSGNSKVNTISWSAGSLDSQWALKYWPSTRRLISNKIAISPDYHGTTLAIGTCTNPFTRGTACTPATAQQAYNATFIATLRNHGGDSAYVPTTNVYSTYDQIVQPQGSTNASGALLDARKVGVTNVLLQDVCGTNTPGGGNGNNHEGVLINALAYALAVDAITKGGPGKLGRVNATALCAKKYADGLNALDVLATSSLIEQSFGDIVAYMPKATGEPAIKSYASKDVPK